MLQGAERYPRSATPVPGVSHAVLTTRLRELCEHGLVERSVEPGPPVAVRYRLTPAGRDVRPVLRSVLAYARRQQPD